MEIDESTEKKDFLLNFTEFYWFYWEIKAKNVCSKGLGQLQIYPILFQFIWIFLNFIKSYGIYWVKKESMWKSCLVSSMSVDIISTFGLTYSLEWGFYLGLQPNLNPLLILSKVYIVLSVRLLCSLSPTVYVIVYSVVCQVTVLPSSNSLSIVYSVLYSLSPIYSCLQCAQSVVLSLVCCTIFLQQFSVHYTFFLQ